MSVAHRPAATGRRPMWPLAVPIGAASVFVALPVLDVSVSDRPARLIIGDPFPHGQELVLALTLLIAARGVLLRRRAAYYMILLMAGLSVLDALGTRQVGRLLMLVAALIVFFRFRAEFTAAPARVRAALHTGLMTYGLALLYGLAVVIADRHHITPGPTPLDVGREMLAGLTGAGSGPLHFDGSPEHWFEASLGVLGGAGLLAMAATVLTPAPPPPTGSAEERAEAARLVDDDGSDTLTPFLLRSDKSYVFSPDRRAVVGYRVLFGIAVVGGDPAGDPRSYAAAVAEFADLAARSGWRMAVLAARGDRLDLWRPYGMRSIGIGDEVLLRVSAFTLTGRRMRNVRQAVQRTRNFGVTTEIVREGELAERDRVRLRSLARAALGGAEERGFSMNLDGLLTGRHTSALIVVARDAAQVPVGFQRYLASAAGRRLSLDAMRRAPGAPNGLNERMIADIMAFAREHGVSEVSLNFAAFRELFDATDRGALERAGYRVVHLLDPLVQVESIYLFNRKFRPCYVPRSVVFPSWAGLATVGAALLLLEFGHGGARERRPDAAGPRPAAGNWPRRPGPETPNGEVTPRW